MKDFVLCILQYLLIMIALVGVGGIGVFLGIKFRKHKDAKAEK